MSEATRFAHLLAAAMEDQLWDPPGEVPSPQRYAAALSGAYPLSAEEKRELLLSPTARLHYQIARAEAKTAAMARLASQGTRLSGLRLAADGGTDTHATVKTEDFTLSIQRDDDDPDRPEWMLVLQISRRLRDAVAGGGLSLALRDDQGLTWLLGAPDADGMLSGVWEHAGSPVARLANQSVRIELV